MQAWHFALPLLSAFIGWLLLKLVINRFLQQAVLLQLISQSDVNSLIPFEAIAQKITDPANIDKILPTVEEHIDHFLRVKLGKSMPMIAMFIGDKTIAQLKGIFMEELQQLFPVLLGGYVKNLQTDLDVKKMLTQKINALSPGQFNIAVRKAISKQLSAFSLLGALAGFLGALIPLLIIWFTKS